MATAERVTVTLPADVVLAIDKLEKNRSRFVLDAVRRELERRRREALRRSLRAPHPESTETAEAGLDAWARDVSEEDSRGLVDGSAGKPVRWIPGEGWREGDE